MTNGRRDVPPAGYFVLESPNEGEVGTLSCPHEGCDGMAFDGAEECHIHDQEYHAGPYSCSKCGVKFAAQSALLRHLAARGHGKERDAAYEAWVSLDAGEYEAMRDAFRDDGVQAGNDCSEMDEDLYVQRAEDSLSDCESEFDNMCTEPCCRRYLDVFGSVNLYRKHLESHNHLLAVGISDSLKLENLGGPEMQAKQLAARELRCGAVGCPELGHRFATSQSFRTHLKSRPHLFPRRVRGGRGRGGAAAQEMTAETGNYWTTPSPVTPSRTIHGLATPRETPSGWSPLQPSSVREEELTRRNVELQAQVSRLQSELAEVRVMSDQRIDALLGLIRG